MAQGFGKVANGSLQTLEKLLPHTNELEKSRRVRCEYECARHTVADLLVIFLMSTGYSDQWHVHLCRRRRGY